RHWLPDWPMVFQNDSIGHPVFADISFYAGIAETDWSWSPVVADFDNDGFRDIIITNGFPKDVTDHDFMAFRNKASALSSKKEILDQIPEVKISNYAYRNQGDLTFGNVTKDWGLERASFSNGGVYADLDNDGDLDLVVNNINDEAYLYKNNFRETNENESNFLDVKFEGGPKNKNGLGARAEIYLGRDHRQVYENTPYRGYLSSVINFAHFGIGKNTKVDSIVVKWPGGNMQIFKDHPANKILTAKESEARETFSFFKDTFATDALFTDITSQSGINYVHEDRDFVDFNIQNLIPHKLSQYGPALAVGDIDGNGLDDIISGGSFFYHAQAFFQQADGKFKRKSIIERNTNQINNPAQQLSSPQSGEPPKGAEDMGLLLFDADGDNDLDLYIARGGYEVAANTAPYQDMLYINDGKGSFTEIKTALPDNVTSKSCVRAADFDKDGDLDLFVAGRVEPGKYPVPVSSFIYRNDTQNGQIRFTDISRTVMPGLSRIGLVCDALFTDFDNDGWQDLILVGEWMRITFIKNINGKFQDVSDASGMGSVYGWWNSIIPGDFDNDGDKDYVLGNFGTNSFYKPTSQYPVNIIAKDFDGNGSFDALTSYFLPQSFSDQQKREVPVHLRDDMIKQIVKT
ncbi:MAG: RNA-binding protein, partial [Chitinophagaceae bacterium]